MNFKLGNKKIAIFIIILALLLIAGGVFWWWVDREPDVGLIPSEEFSIKDTEEGKIIEHKKAGLRVKIPLDWQIIDVRDSLLFTTPDFQLYSEVGPYGPPIPEKGCSIEMSIKKEIEASDYDIEYSYLKLCLEVPSHCGDEVTEVSGSKALKHIYSSESHSVYKGYIEVMVPKNEKIYHFTTYFLSHNKEQCIQEFNEFLETISIK